MPHRLLQASSLLLSLLWTLTPAQYATAIRVKNNVHVCAMKSACQALGFGAKVAEGDTVAVEESSYAQLRFASGSTVEVGPNSEMVLDSAGTEGKKVKTKWGKFNFEIKSRDKKSKFKVQTPVITAGAEGTSFSVTVDAATGDTRLALKSGALQVTNLFAGRRTILMKPGYQIVVKKGIPLPLPEPIPAKTSSRKGQEQESTDDEGSSGQVQQPDESAPPEESPSAERGEAEEAQGPVEDASEAGGDQAQPTQAPESMGTDRLYETGQNASSGFIVQENQELKETTVPPAQTLKKTSRVIIKITEP